MTQTSDAAETKWPLDGFDEFVNKTIEDWKVPGVAVAIVKDGEVILSQGFGKRDVEKGLEVTPQTLFPIGSATKAFTTMVLGMLADEGKVDWDTPVRTYLPTFKLYDAFATERMAPRDLVTHRSGLPRHDLMWYGSPRTRKELFEHLQYLEPTKDLRTVWQYQNLMYMVAGYLVGEIAGMSWEEFVQKRIFGRLGMNSTLFSTTEGQQMADFSLPYMEQKDEVKLIPFYEEQWAVGPAGSIVSNVADMSKWVLLHINKGKYDGGQIISEGQIAQMHAPQMVISGESQYPELLASSYGLGWFVMPYRGHTMVFHGGNIDGFSALVTFLPADHIGVVVLSNLNANPVPGIVTYNVCDRLLGMDEVPWSERNRKIYTEVKQAGEKGKEKTETDRVPDTHPSHALDAYTGEYENVGYGVISIEREGEELQIKFNSIVGPLKHYHYDIFELVVEKFDLSMKVSFTTNVRGDIDGFSAPLEPLVKDIVFKRVARKEMTEKSFLEQFVGDYEVLGMTATVALKGEKTLSLAIPGQPEFELVPYKGTEFHLKGLSGFGVEFKRDEEGKVIEAVLEQPGAVFTAKKK
jgi:CubicO group peptidase (beta-lactamase class C family)